MNFTPDYFTGIKQAEFVRMPASGQIILKAYGVNPLLSGSVAYLRQLEAAERAGGQISLLRGFEPGSSNQDNVTIEDIYKSRSMIAVAGDSLANVVSGNSLWLQQTGVNLREGSGPVTMLPEEWQKLLLGRAAASISVPRLIKSLHYNRLFVSELERFPGQQRVLLVDPNPEKSLFMSELWGAPFGRSKPKPALPGISMEGLPSDLTPMNRLRDLAEIADLILKTTTLYTGWEFARDTKPGTSLISAKDAVFMNWVDRCANLVKTQ